MELDAIVLATDALANVRIAGLTAKERAVRVARRVGATNVLVATDRSQIAAWSGQRTVPLLVIRADQLVHTPLVAPLIEALPSDGIVASVVPENPVVQDLTPGSPAGAWVASASRRDELVANLDSPTATSSVTHGAVARAPIATPAQRRAAHKVLYTILIKPQDNAITRYLYRPVSFPLTRLLVWTPITPNQVSYLVAVLVAIGCYLSAKASNTSVLIGTAILLAGSYVDCCDGEIARVKLLSSKLGAWIDTIVDELSSIGYMVALGWHCHLVFGTPGLDGWLVANLVGAAAITWSVYCIYYNIIVAVGSANSQDYVGAFEIAPGKRDGAVKLVPRAAKAIATKKPLPPWLQFLATYLPYVVRRDLIAWVTLGLAALSLAHVSFVLLVAGGIVTATIVTIDHVKLRSLRRSIARRGLQLEAP
ncbi:MAG: CDP-alcohol phosphatidyltransferase family protein [Kofleriaceae bacterium]